MVDEDWIHDVSDAVILKKKGVLELMENEGNIIPMEIMKKPPTEMTGFSHKASTAVAKQIIFEANLTNLLNAMENG